MISYLNDGSFLVVGYTCQDHLLVDLDNSYEFIAKQIAIDIQHEWPFLGDCLLVRSSDKHHHLIFDNFVQWETLVRIIEILADLGIVQKNYAQVRTFRRDLTLRISDKKGEDRYRPPPEIVCEIINGYPSNDHYGITKYIYYLRMFNPDQHVEHWIDRPFE